MRICKTIKILKSSNLLNYHICILSVQTIQTNAKMKNKNLIKKIEQLDFSYFNIRHFEIPKYRPFYILSFQILTPTQYYSESRFFFPNKLDDFLNLIFATEPQGHWKLVETSVNSHKAWQIQQQWRKCCIYLHPRIRRVTRTVYDI